MIVPISEVALGDYKDQLPQCPECCCNRGKDAMFVNGKRVFSGHPDVLTSFYSFDKVEENKST